MWWHCTCILGLLRPSSVMRIKNKSLIVGVRTPPGARNLGSFLRNGSGISASHWGTRSIPHPCARRNLLLQRRAETAPFVKPARVWTPPPQVQSGSAQWARPSFTGGFPGSAFLPQPDGTLRCPADHPLSPQERRPERDGSLPVVYAARIGHCRACALRQQCQESPTTLKARRVSALYPPVSSSSSISEASPPAPGEPFPPLVPHPVRL